MSEPEGEKRKPDARNKMVSHIEEKQDRKIRARRTKDRGIWFGLGTMGTIGWSVVVPTILGVALGIWIDTQWPGPVSWTVMLLFGGLLLGCLNAWFWIAHEQRVMEREKEEGDDDE